METHTLKTGAIEIVGTLAAAAALLKIFRNIVEKLRDAMSEKEAIMNVLADQLQCIIREYELLNKPTPPASVEVLLNQLSAEAAKLLKSVSAGKFHRLVANVRHDKLETRIGKLRTGIDDVGKTLQLASRLNAYQVGPALAQQHVASAPALASAPAPAFMEVTFTCPIPPNMDAAQALVGVLQGRIPAPQGYPPPPAAVSPPVYYPTAFFSSCGPPGYSYAPKY